MFRLYRTLCCRGGHREGGGHGPQRQRRKEGDLRGPAGPSQAGGRVHPQGDRAAGLRDIPGLYRYIHPVQVSREGVGLVRLS